MLRAAGFFRRELSPARMTNMRIDALFARARRQRARGWTATVAGLASELARLSATRRRRPRCAWTACVLPPTSQRRRERGRTRLSALGSFQAAQATAPHTAPGRARPRLSRCLNPACCESRSSRPSRGRTLEEMLVDGARPTGTVGKRCCRSSASTRPPPTRPPTGLRRRRSRLRRYHLFGSGTDGEPAEPPSWCLALRPTERARLLFEIAGWATDWSAGFRAVIDGKRTADECVPRRADWHRRQRPRGRASATIASTARSSPGSPRRVAGSRMARKRSPSATRPCVCPGLSRRRHVTRSPRARARTVARTDQGPRSAADTSRRSVSALGDPEAVEGQRSAWPPMRTVALLADPRRASSRVDGQGD